MGVVRWIGEKGCATGQLERREGMYEGLVGVVRRGAGVVSWRGVRGACEHLIGMVGRCAGSSLKRRMAVWEQRLGVVRRGARVVSWTGEKGM